MFPERRLCGTVSAETILQKMRRERIGMKRRKKLWTLIEAIAHFFVFGFWDFSIKKGDGRTVGSLHAVRQNSAWWACQYGADLHPCMPFSSPWGCTISSATCSATWPGIFQFLLLEQQSTCSEGRRERAESATM